MTPSTPTHALVIGGSVAGLFAARVLSDHFDAVTIIERDALPTGPEYRAGVPQARHLHSLLARGQHIADELFPGFTETMNAAGCPRGEWGELSAFLVTGGWTPRFNSGIFSNISGRVTVEWLLRERVAALPNVRFLNEREVESLTADDDDAVVTGVRVVNRRDKSVETLAAELVVDASGRNSKAPQWLAALGYDAPQTTIINAHTGYASRWYRLPAGVEPELKAVGVQPRPAEGNYRGGGYLIVENDDVVVTLLGANGDYPPTDEAGFLEFARGLPTPLLYDLIVSAEPITPIYGYRKLENQERHYERLARRPEGFIITGDAAVALNPIYGQGMTTAAIEALALRDLLKQSDVRDLRGFAGRFQRKLHQVTRGPWMMSTAEDMRYPGVEGGQAGPMLRLIHRYFDLVALTMPHDPVISKAFFEAMALLKDPGAALMHPLIVLRVLYHSVRLRAGATTQREPGIRFEPVEA